MSQATLNGTLTNDGGDPAGCYCTFRYGTDPTVDGNGNLINYTEVSAGTGLTSALTPQLLHALTGLDPDTEYYFQTTAHNSAGDSYGEVLNFITHGIIAVIDIPTVLGIGRYNATLDCNLVNDGGETCTLGFMWGTDPDNLADSITVASGRSPRDFSVDLNSFQPDATYYFAAFAVNSIGTIVSSIVSFHTDTALDKLPVLPPYNPPGGPNPPPPPILPVPPNPIQPIINFTNIGLAIGGTASAMVLMFPSDTDDKKKKKDIKQIGNKKDVK